MFLYRLPLQVLFSFFQRMSVTSKVLSGHYRTTPSFHSRRQLRES